MLILFCFFNLHFLFVIVFFSCFFFGVLRQFFKFELILLNENGFLDVFLKLLQPLYTIPNQNNNASKEHEKLISRPRQTFVEIVSDLLDQSHCYGPLTSSMEEKKDYYDDQNKKTFICNEKIVAAVSCLKNVLENALQTQNGDIIRSIANLITKFAEKQVYFIVKVLFVQGYLENQM